MQNNFLAIIDTPRSKAYSESYYAFKTEHFAKIVNDL